ncbi:MAG: HAD-IIIC family phosphatase [Bryobacterales bacterium]|nr:HAD-IIIC family phosphatase [Bryobacterales bacterium]
MKISEALKVLQSVPREGEPFEAALVCGFTPLHLETLLGARLQQRLSGRRIAVAKGLFGDTAGTLESLRGARPHAVALALEWQDLDPRLGFRAAGAWNPAAVADIVTSAARMLDRMGAAVEQIEPGVPVACCLPTLPLPPLFHTPGWQSSEACVLLEGSLNDFALRVVRRPGAALADTARLAQNSPPAARFDLKSDLASGLPYTLAHADAVAEALALLLVPPAPKKGLVTDLDDTLWHGLVGEIGPENVSWDLDSHHPVHGLYQKLLASFAEEGVLIGVASKNDAQVAARALARPDILLPPGKIYPLEVHWNPKSGSVGRILKAWNIGADSVVFVDDSPMELAEVAAAHPGIECVLFPKSDPAACLALLRRLRDWFGKPRIAGEDALRLESIRQGEAFREVESGGGAEAFLSQADATLTIDFAVSSSDARTLELVNKTNQFNLNGVRFTEGDWLRLLANPNAILAAVSYQDKFGPLGKIAVLAGHVDGDEMRVNSWVMSCRAFSRRIEHRCLQSLFDRCAAREIIFDFRPTAKNGPLQDFFESLTGGRPQGPFRLTREQFEEKRPLLYHRIVETESTSWMPSQPA